MYAVAVYRTPLTGPLIIDLAGTGFALLPDIRDASMISHATWQIFRYLAEEVAASVVLVERSTLPARGRLEMESAHMCVCISPRLPMRYRPPHFGELSVCCG